MSSRPEGRRNPFNEEVDSEGSWAISYGDMITLLLTFFILFFNVDHRESEQRMAIQESLLEKLKPMSKPLVEIGRDRKIAGIEEEEIAKWGARVYKMGDRLVIEFPDFSFFDKGKTDVRKAGEAKLEEFVKLYLPFMGSNMLSIRAFTDTLKVSGGHRFHDNLELSALRSISAMRVLLKAGVPLHLMRISGNGEFPSIVRKINENEFRRLGDPVARKIVLVIEPMTKDRI